MAREVCIGMMGRTCAVSNPGYVVYNIYGFTIFLRIISVMIPQESWVSKWQRIGKKLYTHYHYPSLSHTQTGMYQAAMQCQ